MTTTTTTAGRRAPLVVLLTGQAMASMDTSIAAVAAPTIRLDLAGPPALAQLVLAGYTLAFAVLVVTGARIGSRHGPARVFLLGLTGFTVASLACGLAPEPVTLVGARVVQGAMAALMVPQVLALIQATYVGTARGRAIGAYSMILALGVAAGQVAGGLLVTLDAGGLAWRTAFLVNVPVGAVLLVAGRRALAAMPAAATRPAALDLPGVLLLAAAMLALVGPAVLGGDLGWPSWSTPVGVAAGVVGVGVFLRHEGRLIRRGGTPLLDVAVLTRVGVPAGLLAACLVMGCYAGFLFTLTLRLQEGLGFTALAAGLAFLPYAAGFALCGLAAPRLSGRLRDALPLIGPPLLAAVVLVVTMLTRDDWQWLPGSLLLFVGGAAHAAGFTPLVDRLATALPAGAATAFSALISTGTLLAAVLGVTVIGGLHLTRPDTPAAAALTAGLLLAAPVAAGRCARALNRPAGPPSTATDPPAPTVAASATVTELEH
ncbi:MFS transporter [Micromonospora sp. WMMC250]|uniref:MFS transporter n=1 Tax=Micromonospora sp. WMMC250 TaxID=3014781 RepID=UPI0022B6B730|nr:MFS transporter [Micromonospora sp. WMMC250]MCZ7379134.1 MFS transporter [Micromonospora sp. WMMC250]